MRRHFFRKTVRRLYLDEIQALVAERTPAGGYASLVLVLLLLITGLFAATGLAGWAQLWGATASGTPWPMLFSLLVVMGVVTIALVVNLVLGPTCVFEIHTPVVRECIPCVGRWRDAQRVIALLEPEIRAVQGTLPEDARLRLGANRVPRGQMARPDRQDNGKAHALLFLLCLLLAASAVIEFFVASYFKDLLDHVLLLVALGAGTMALARQQHSNIPPGVRTVTGALITLTIVYFYLVNVGVIISTFLSFEDMMAQSQLYMYSGTVPELAPPVRRALSVASLVVFGPASLAGLIAVRRFQRTQHALRTKRPAPYESHIETDSPAQ